ncbi:MAG: mechanosensitive ion channel family protein [Lachnospiraceae bacterium]|nr:mechanosensitive ion channel family protein [Lachnospiraceae bacterium]
MLRSFGKLIETHIQDIWDFLYANPSVIIPFLLFVFFATLIIIAFYIFLAWACFKISGRIFRSVEKKRGKTLLIQFTQYIINLVIILLFVVIPLGGDKISQSILGSAAVLAAVIGFAAQDVIRDVLAGLQISFHKPFDIGDRIELEDGTAGIVNSITMRHVVLTLIDTVKLIIPNSKLNCQTIRNLSYDYVPRSAEFSFPVAYDTDIKKAKSVIFDAVKNCDLSIPGKKDANGEMIYAPVYFISIADSALIMKVTVYFDHKTPTEVLKDGINTGVFEALAQAGISIPYPHTTVIMQQTAN